MIAKAINNRYYNDVRMRKNISIEKLRLYCIAYDEINGDYPENEYEGEHVLKFILECEGIA